MNSCSCAYNEQIYHYEITKKSYANAKENESTVLYISKESTNQNIMIWYLNVQTKYYYIYTFPGAKYFVQNLFIWYTSYFKRLYYYFFGTVSTYTISYFTKTTSHPRENAFITSICVKKLANNCHYAGASKFWKGSFALENRTPIKLWKR